MVRPEKLSSGSFGPQKPFQGSFDCERRPRLSNVRAAGTDHSSITVFSSSLEVRAFQK